MHWRRREWEKSTLAFEMEEGEYPLEVLMK